MIIGISGKKNSGKDLLGSILCYCFDQADAIANNPNWREEYDMIPYTEETYEDWLSHGDFSNEWQIKKFGYAVKQIVSLLTGCKIEDLEDRDFKESAIGDAWRIDDHYITYRELMEDLATKVVRDIHPNTWVNKLMGEYGCTCGASPNDKVHVLFENCSPPNWIITDVRFPNEVKAIEGRDGIVIRMFRPETEVASDKPSETALDDYPFSFTIINNANIQYIIDRAREFLLLGKYINE